MSDTAFEVRQRVGRNHKEAVAALEYAHECSLELRRHLDALPSAERDTEGIRLLLRAVDDSDALYEQTRVLLDRQQPQ